MPAKDRTAAFSRLTGSAQLQAALGAPRAATVELAPAPEPGGVAPAPESNGHADKPRTRREPVSRQGLSQAAAPEGLNQAAARLAQLQARRATETVTLFGYTVPKTAGDEATVQTTVRMSVTMRHVIDAFCREFDVTFQEFATLAYEHLLETAAQAR